MNALITLKAVSKTYHLGKTKVQALRKVDLVVNQGEFTALQGPSGSGKSTLLNICGLLDTFDEGTFLFDGRDISSFTNHQLTLERREGIGFVFQNFNLVPVMTAFENVEYPLLLAGRTPEERRERTLAVLEQAGLAEFADHRPDQLSGGQRQRVAIARALVKKPALVIADEPTANLDSDTAYHIIEFMHTLGRDYGTTFLIATHDERMARHCTRTLQLTDGILQGVLQQ
uniref:Putative ABC transport system ATP-binding protein n=1 Tax=Candidatus Kentrum sp. TUN TaxID=2126343 RepID=A0A450ZGL7_9GAMM|nr:MAG: putative ABC transport system ATP-binding protein [Candidatus Kentron sp. TUN]VFK53437.1 MAG: putative ABC transport system ATP-binding protein [Candidatus Kentron sp. TUN]VFK59954.1 MAG: putative ABC transport system ATP-binding protein [Candidatus Kentron sp. TUN]